MAASSVLSNLSKSVKRTDGLEGGRPIIVHDWDMGTGDASGEGCLFLIAGTKRVVEDAKEHLCGVVIDFGVLRDARFVLDGC
jgi:hypothetical protein